jgi:hypothetical protein
MSPRSIRLALLFFATIIPVGWWLTSRTEAKVPRGTARSAVVRATANHDERRREEGPERYTEPHAPAAVASMAAVPPASSKQVERPSLRELSAQAEREAIDPRWARETEARIVTGIRNAELPKGVVVESVRCGSARCVLRANGEEQLVRESQQKVLDAIQLPRGRLWFDKSPTGSQLVVISAREGFDVMGQPTGTVP